MLIFERYPCRYEDTETSPSIPEKDMPDIVNEMLINTTEDKVADNDSPTLKSVDYVESSRHSGGTLHHIPHQIPQNGKKRYRQLRCVMCRDNGFPRDTRYYCNGCSEKPALCKKLCFYNYHKKYNLLT